MTPQLPLGSELITLTLAVRGRLTVQGGIRLLHRVIRRVNMKVWHEPYVQTFPTPEGEGGYGFTIFQTLVESFAVIDCWDEHQGFYLAICSCRPYDAWQVINLLETLGYDVIDAGGSVVRLKRRPSWLRRLISWFGWG